MSLLAALRAAGAAGSPDAMRAMFALARAAGLDDPRGDSPSEARALMRRMALAGRADLAFGRLFEGHVNAIQLVRAHGDRTRNAALDEALATGAILGVWNSDAPGRPLRIENGKFIGGKNFASGAGIVSHPLVTTAANDPVVTLLHLVALDDAPATVDRGWWHPIGMARTESHIVHLDGIAAPPPIGPPGAYQRQPAFSAGALRFVAVQAGGVHALFDAARDHLVAAGRDRHPIQRQRLARLFALADAGYALIDRTAAAWSIGESGRLIALVSAARGAIEVIATEALALAKAAVGVQGLLHPHPLARVATDLDVYLRQPDPDGQRDAAGAAAAAGLIVPGDADA